MSIELLNPDIFFLALFPIVSYLLKVFLKPSKGQAMAITRAVSWLLVGLIKGVRNWYVKHQDHAEPHLKSTIAKVYEKFHHPDEQVIG